MTAVRILRLMPELLQLNGSLGNAEVLATRASWFGAEVSVENAEAGSVLTERPDIVTIGHGTSSTLAPCAVAIQHWTATLKTSRDLFHQAVQGGGKVALTGCVVALWRRDWTHVESLIAVPDASVPSAASVALVGPWHSEEEAKEALGALRLPSGARGQARRLSVCQGPQGENAQVHLTWTVFLDLGASDCPPPQAQLPVALQPLLPMGQAIKAS